MRKKAPKILRHLVVLSLIAGSGWAGAAWAQDAVLPEGPPELIVLLAPGSSGAPTAEEVVEASLVDHDLPGGLGTGSARSARFAITHRTTGTARARLLAEPESPRARLERYVVLTYPRSADLSSIKIALEANPWVLHVEENTFASFSVTPNDPLFPIAASPTQYQWGLHTLNFPAAWDRIKGHAFVGLVDTGVEVNHPDLRAFHWSGSSWVYDGGNFRSHLSWDFLQGDGNVDENDPLATWAGHGTHTSGLVAATVDNATGVAGGCWHCSLLMCRFTGSKTTTAQSIVWLVDHGAQIISMSFGWLTNEPGLGIVNDALAVAEGRDVAMFASPGNDKLDIEFPASDSRVVSVGGIEFDESFWVEEVCPRPGYTGTTECGSNYTLTPGTKMQELVAPAQKVLSTMYTGKDWNTALGCGDSTEPNPGYGLCTGTSMSAPYGAAVAGLLRSANPLLSKTAVRSLLIDNADRAGAWHFQFGHGVPDAAASVEDAMGRAGGQVLANRLSPLFSLYSATAEDHLYTSSPQTAAAAWEGLLYQDCPRSPGGVCSIPSIPYQPVGSSVPGYTSFPGAGCTVSPCVPPIPRASVYLFTSYQAPYAGAPPLVPLYRMSYRGTNPANGNTLNRDAAYTTEAAGIEAFKNVGYDLDGVEGYIYKKCTPEPTCIPVGAVRLLRRYNLERDDVAIFPESELSTMESVGYTSLWGAPHLGYVYPNADSDGDQLIDGFETILGTSLTQPDSDCDGLADGLEVLTFPYADPRGAPGCGTQPPTARFTFSCSQLACSFDSSTSTDDVLITNRNWSVGGSSFGSGVTASRVFAAAGSYTVTLTVTDNAGNQNSISKKVSVIDISPLPAESYFAVTPCRLLDTRSGPPLNGNQWHVFNVAGSCGIPATAKAVAFNVGVVSATGQGFLIFAPGNQSFGPFPHSTLNFVPSPEQRFNNAVLRLATNGAGTLAVWPAAAPQLHLLLDVYGYFSEDPTPAPGATGPLGFQTLAPCRVLDTRSTSALTQGVSRSFALQGVCGVPAGAPVAAVNLTAVYPSDAGNVRIFPSDTVTTLPTVGFPAGTFAQANGARMPLASSAPDARVLFSSSNPGATAHAIVDAYGYFKSGAPLRYRPITPCRLLDTRLADQGAPAFARAETRNIQVQGNCGVPLGAKAAVLNVTSVSPGGVGWLILYPAGTPSPLFSAMNFSPAQGYAVANGVTVALSSQPNDLAVTCAESTSHVVIDVFGYFQ